MSTRDELRALIAAASAPPPAAVTVEGLGRVWVRVMTPFDSEASRRALDAHGKQADGTPLEDGCHIGRLLATVLCDETGAPLYEVGNADDVLMLSKLPGAVNQAIFAAHRRANGITTAEEAEALGKA
jgi:hypothetical protein